MILVVDYDLKKMKFWACENKKKGVSIRQFAEDIDGFNDDSSLKKYIRSIAGNNRVKTVAFRILFGGDYFDKPERVNGQFFPRFEKLTDFFPFYVPALLEILKRFRRVFSGVPLIAFFETSFFVNLPEEEKYYALPFNYYKNSRIKKWGFHGIFHQTNAELFPPEEKTVSIVLDKQTTVCAVSNNKPLSISLGYTPLEGVMSRKSCGDVDPGIVFYLMNAHDFSIYDIDEMLKNRSGFLGLTGYDIELKEMLSLRGRDPKVDLAFDVYRAQIIKQIGEGAAFMGGLDNLVFAGSQVNTLLPLIHGIIKEISFLGVNTRSLPWGSNEEISLVSSAESKVKVFINRIELAKIIFYQSEIFLGKSGKP